MEKKRLAYEPPQARDLSAFSVSGQGPLGACVAGPTPWYDCVTGPGYSSGSCVTGPMPDDTSFCDAGFYHTQPACDFGGSAATICISGASQQ